MDNNKIPSPGHNINISIIVSYLLLYLLFPIPNEKIIKITIIKQLVYNSYCTKRNLEINDYNFSRKRQNFKCNGHL